MKHLTISFIIITLVLPPAWADCSKMDEFHQIIQTLEGEIVQLRETRTQELSKSEMQHILADKPKSGSELLREQEEQLENITKLKKRQTKEAWYATIPSVFLALMSGVIYKLYSDPPASKLVFSEYLMREIDGVRLSRISSKLFAGFLLLSVGILSYKYYSLQDSLDETLAKIESLETMATIEDTINARKRHLEHYQIELQLFMRACAPSTPAGPLQ